MTQAIEFIRDHHDGLFRAWLVAVGLLVAAAIGVVGSMVGGSS